MKQRAARFIRSPWFAQLVAAVVLLGLAVWQSDTHEIAQSLRKVRPEWLLVALVIYAALRFEHALESRIVLTRVGRVPMLGLYGVLLIGSLVNAVLPANMGDVAKLQIFANRYGLSRVALVASRGAEAVVNGVMFVVFVIIGVILASGQANGHEGLQWVFAIVSSAFCGVLIVAAILMPEELPRWGLLRHMPRRAYRVLEEHWPRIHEGFEAVRRPRLLASLIVLNIIGWTMEIAMYWAYGQAFNLDVPLGAYVSVAVVISVVTTFPITFGNVGSWEFAILGALHIYNVPTDVALAFAVGIHVFVTLFNIGLGLIAMVLLGVRAHELYRVKGSGDGAPAAGTGTGSIESSDALTHI